MKKERTTLELLKELREILKDEGYDIIGLCWAIDFVLRNKQRLTLSEHKDISTFVKNNLPKNKYRWVYREAGRVERIKSSDTFDEFYWKPYSMKPRIKFIEKLIKKLEK